MTMGLHRQGFTAQALTQQPEGYPEIGYEFEHEYPYDTHSTSPGATVWTYRVIGWEMHLDAEGAERISVRVRPVSKRLRLLDGMRRCDMGHWHPTFTGEGPRGVAPEVWGFG